MPSVEYSYKKRIEQQETLAAGKTTPIVYGNFPSFKEMKDLSIYRLNRLLTCILAITLFISMICYSAVVAQEVKISSIHREINDYNFDNIELQNKVDNLKSFYSIDKKVSKSKTLHKPSDILEVSAIKPTLKAKKAKNGFNIKSILGY